MGAKGNKLAKLYAFDNSRYSRKAKTIEITIIESWKSFSESTYSVKFVLSHPACRTFEKAALKLVSSGQAVFVYQGF